MNMKKQRFEEMNGCKSNHQKQQTSNVVMIYQGIDSAPLFITGMLTYFIPVVLTYCRTDLLSCCGMEMLHYIHNKAMKENCKSVFIE